MDFKIDTEILNSLNTFLNGKAETLNNNIESIKSAIEAFQNGWEGEDATTFMNNCNSYIPVLNAVHETTVAYNNIVKEVAADAEICIQAISDAISNIG